MSAPYARFFTPPLRGGSFPLPRARDVVKTSVFTRPRKRDSSTVSGTARNLQILWRQWGDVPYRPPSDWETP